MPNVELTGPRSGEALEGTQQARAARLLGVRDERRVRHHSTSLSASHQTEAHALAQALRSATQPAG
jgi:hypothetical protein